ncbi:LamG domain-containing protein [Cellulomonas sp. NPDC055163]
MSTPVARSARAHAPARVRVLATLLLAAVVGVVGTGAASAVFSVRTTNTSTLAAAATFPNYSTQVLGAGPLFYHRGEEPSSTLFPSDALDSSGNGRTGTYTGRTDGPDLWWTADEGTGSTLADRSGSDNTGTLRGNATWTTGIMSGGVTLDGSGDWVESATTSVSTNGPYSVAVWVRLANADGTRVVLSQPSTAPGGTQSGFVLRWVYESAATGHWEWARASSDANGAAYALAAQGAGQPAPVGRWVHLVATYTNDTSSALYVDGAQVAFNGSATEISTAGPLQVGRALVNGTYAASQYLAGAVDDVRAYKRDLTAAEVAELHQGTSDSLVGAWGFDDSATAAPGFADGSVRGNLLTAPGVTVAAAPGPVRRGSRSVYLDGSAGDPGTATSAALRTDQSFTVMAWVAPENLTVTRAILSQDTALDTASSKVSAFALTYRRSQGKFAFALATANTNDGTSDSAVGSTVPVESTSAAPTWYHVTGVYDREAGVARLYVDGVLEATVPHTVPFDGTGLLQLGRDRTSDAYRDPFQGWIDDVRVFQRALPQAAVQAHLEDGVALARATAARRGALRGAQGGETATTAVTYSGARGSGGYNPSTWSSPTAVTLECWFRTTSTRGGVLLQLASTGTGMPAAHDRTLYVTPSGAVAFATFKDTVPTALQVLTSPATYRDGAWHHVTATLSPTAGSALYVDGAPVAANAAWTTASTLPNGVWRWGGGNTSTLPNRATGEGFAGSIDEIAVYGTALTEQQVAWSFHANH